MICAEVRPEASTPSPFERLTTLLHTPDCCESARQRGLRYCLECDGGAYDVRELTPGRADRANFSRIHSAFEQMKRGSGKAADVVAVAHFVQLQARAGVSNLTRVLAGGGLLEDVRELCEETRDAQQTLARLTGAFIREVERRDIPAAQGELDVMRVHMQDMDALQLRTVDLSISARPAA